MKFAFIKERLGEFPVRAARDSLPVSRAGYHAWRKRSPGGRACRRQELVAKIKT